MRERAVRVWFLQRVGDIYSDILAFGDYPGCREALHDASLQEFLAHPDTMEETLADGRAYWSNAALSVSLELAFDTYTLEPRGVELRESDEE